MTDLEIFRRGEHVLGTVSIPISTWLSDQSPLYCPSDTQDSAQRAGRRLGGYLFWSAVNTSSSVQNEHQT